MLLQWGLDFHIVSQAILPVSMDKAYETRSQR